jgi:nucleoside-diphosphate-sugar epimerase
MSNSFSKGTALITGASSGIGAVYADRLARRGYDLILVARRGDRLDTLAERLRREQKVALQTVVADLTAPDDLSRVEGVVAGNERVTMLWSQPVGPGRAYHHVGGGPGRSGTCGPQPRRGDHSAVRGGCDLVGQL